MDDIEEKPSRALPIGVGACLAVAVFGVLLAIRGTGKPPGGPPVDTPVVATNDKPADKPAEPVVDKPADKPAEPVATNTTPPPVTTTPTSTTPPPADKPADKPADTGSTLATLTFVVTPKEALSKLDVTVDKKPVLGDRFQVQKGDAPVKVIARSPGYVTFEKDIVPTADQAVTIELKKVETATATPSTTKPPPAVTKTPPPTPTTRTPPSTTSTPKKPKKPKIEL